LPLPSVKAMTVLVEARQVLPKFLRFCMLMTGKTLTERREDAIRYAGECPAAEFATIEVREIGPCWEK